MAAPLLSHAALSRAGRGVDGGAARLAARLAHLWSKRGTVRMSEEASAALFAALCQGLGLSRSIGVVVGTAAARGGVPAGETRIHRGVAFVQGTLCRRRRARRGRLRAALVRSALRETRGERRDHSAMG